PREQQAQEDHDGRCRWLHRRPHHGAAARAPRADRLPPLVPGDRAAHRGVSAVALHPPPHARRRHQPLRLPVLRRGRHLLRRQPLPPRRPRHPQPPRAGRVGVQSGDPQARLRLRRRPHAAPRPPHHRPRRRARHPHRVGPRRPTRAGRLDAGPAPRGARSARRSAQPPRAGHHGARHRRPAEAYPQQEPGATRLAAPPVPALPGPRWSHRLGALRSGLLVPAAGGTGHVLLQHRARPCRHPPAVPQVPRYGPRRRAPTMRETRRRRGVRNHHHRRPRAAGVRRGLRCSGSHHGLQVIHAAGAGAAPPVLAQPVRRARGHRRRKPGQRQAGRDPADDGLLPGDGALPGADDAHATGAPPGPATRERRRCGKALLGRVH
ncbi:hypothetical protein BS78_02G110000, partial [Paspalum vaginatum]